MQEQWRTVAGFPDYSVSNLGRVRRDIASKRSRAGRILKGWVTLGGYHRACLTLSGIESSILVHRLVAVAFIGPAPTDAHEAAHWDGVPANNRVDNLRWTTRAENERDKSRHGTDPVGERHGQAKLTECDVRAIRAEYAAGGRIQADIGTRYGVSGSQVSRIVRRVLWPHLPD
jgi:hypothetical protein